MSWRTQLVLIIVVPLLLHIGLALLVPSEWQAAGRFLIAALATAAAAKYTLKLLDE